MNATLCSHANVTDQPSNSKERIYIIRIYVITENMHTDTVSIEHGHCFGLWILVFALQLPQNIGGKVLYTDESIWSW